LAASPTSRFGAPPFTQRRNRARERGNARKEKETMSVRPIKRIVQSKPAIEGAGVKLRRAFGFGNTSDFDPFLLLDDFRNERPEDYLAGFPWHPHRGIETITYVLTGTVDHGDSLGNRGNLGAGDVQWMTAGSGILHQEMPRGDAQGRMHGFQLWANLPSALKMTKPRYQDVVSKDIPEVTDDDGTRVRIICGDFWGKSGPVDGVAADPRYLDVSVPPIENTRHAFAYVFAGSATFRDASEPRSVRTEHVGAASSRSGETADRSLVLFDSGDEIVVQAGDDGVRFLLVSGKPIEEPVAWYGPIVMNTEAELQRAYSELRDGTFIKGR
jgi:redox-sensitive bicupin YhaK (pirin superfamily)